MKITTCEFGETYCGKPIVAQFPYDPPSSGTFWVCEDHIAAAEKCGHKLIRRIPAGAMPIEHFDTRSEETKRLAKVRAERDHWKAECRKARKELRAAGKKAT